MTYFISGHTDLSYEEFEEHYVPILCKIFSEDRNPEFVMGDFEGVDKYAMNYIFYKEQCPITIYHTGKFPKNVPEAMTDPEIELVYFKGGYATPEDADKAMTEVSDFDIVYIKK